MGMFSLQWPSHLLIGCPFPTFLHCSQERQVTLPSTLLLSLYPSKRPLSPMFLKKKTWSNNLDNFRLISNFQFISKILNPTVIKKNIIVHLLLASFFPPPQLDSLPAHHIHFHNIDIATPKTLSLRLHTVILLTSMLHIRVCASSPQSDFNWLKEK